ncbi:MAG: Mrp/NBP35 family ATP-binding protein [Deltaproteobacteria bacterium]|nr:Mrp/NBP35 family ATP-binding protein [Deltaproteobacteria bacterium]
MLDTVERLGQKYLILSGKGGVGKTTIAANLAWAKAKAGFRVGLLDIDLHGPDLAGALYHEASVEVDYRGFLLPSQPRENLWVLTLENLLEDKHQAVMWRGPRKMRAIIQFIGETAWPELDYFFIDSPPGTGDETLTVLRNIPQLKALVVSTGHRLAISDVSKALDCLKTCGAFVAGLIDNFSEIICPGCGQRLALHDPGATAALAKETGHPFLGSLVMDPAAVQAAERVKKPLVEAAANSPLAEDIIKLAEKI